MVKITDARWETSTEKQQRIDYFAKKQNNSKEYSVIYCNQFNDKLVKWYNEFKVDYTNELILKEEKTYQQRLKSFIDYKKSCREKDKIIDDIRYNNAEYLCECGNKLKYVENFNFVGCTNYRDKSKHHSYINYTDWEKLNQQELNITVNPVEYSKNHLDLFRVRYDIPKNVKMSVIYKTLKSNGVEFLCDINESRFNIGRNASNNSNLEEILIKEILENKFEKVSYQPGIKYKTESSLNWQVKIPDYICQNSESIFVFDAKKNIDNIDIDQLKFYHELVDFIRFKHGINKQVKSYFIVFDPLNTDKISNCLTINKLKSL